MTPVDAMLERLRPHVERYLSDGACTGFKVSGRLVDICGVWKVSSEGAWDDEALRSLQEKADKERRLTAVR